MRSSTSNSNQRIPRLPYAKLCLTACALSILGLVAAETSLRALGYEPNIVLDMPHWTKRRHRLETGPNEKHIVILGNSRAQTDLVPSIIREMAPGYNTTMLAVPGQAGFATLRDIAENTRYAGVVLCLALPDELNVPLHGDAQKPWVEYYHAHRADLGNHFGHLNDSIVRWFREHLVLASIPTADLCQTVKLGQVMPRRRICHPEGNTSINYSAFPEQFQAELPKRMHQVVLRKAKEKPMADPAEWPESIAEHRKVVRKIQARGGRIVFIRPPTTGTAYELQTKAYPRADYWDGLAEELDAVTIHFEDLPSVAGMDCPDGAHLDRTDVPRFTSAIVRELVKAGIIQVP